MKLFFRNKNSIGSILLCLFWLIISIPGAVILIVTDYSVIWGILLIVCSVIVSIACIYMIPSKIQNGIIYTPICQKIAIKNASVIFLTNYSNTTGMGQNPLFVHVKEDGTKVNAMYLYLLKNISQQETDNLEKYHESHIANQKFGKETLMFRTSYKRNLLACLFENGFNGEIYIFRQLYECYFDELQAIFEHHSIKNSLNILEYRTDNGEIKPDFTLSGTNMYQ